MDVVAELAREEGGRLLALLAARFNDLELAEDSLQEAFARAVTAWREEVPEQPAAWVHRVARNLAIDQVRRRDAMDRRIAGAARDIAETPEGPTVVDQLIAEDTEVGDERLRLMLLCCHPALDPEAQVALTLRLVGGLTTAEIAAAYLVPEPTMAQRIVRAKRKIRKAAIALTIPANLDERADALLGVLYLIFNEGYLARGREAGSPVRVDLADEAIRLAEVAAELLPTHGEPRGLLALMLYHRARFGARLDGAGDLVLLPDQDRGTWDRALAERGRAVLSEAVRRPGIGPYRLQALIAGVHARSESVEETDWAVIVSLYRLLERVRPGPVVALNRALAVAMAEGAGPGLAQVESIAGLQGYHLWHAARGDLLLRTGAPARARAAFARALELTQNPSERRHLEHRMAACGP